LNAVSGLLLVVRLAGERVALLASEVEAVVEVEEIVPVPRSARHVAGLTALRSRVLTVIDCLASLDPHGGRAAAAGDAVVAVCDGHPYALLVDAVEDVVESRGEPRPPGAALGGGWERLARGVVEADGDLLLLLDVGALVAGCRVEAA
jgi:purine-binding chemotaxis protein CheW